MDPKDLHSLFRYVPETGDLLWKVSRNSYGKRIRPGDIAGSIDGKGRIAVGINGRLYYAHRIVWAMNYGEWPSKQIDHKDRDQSNNRLENLRLATNSDNQANQSLGRNNTSGFKGVSLHRKTGKWAAEVQCNGKRKRLGLFSDKIEAAKAYNREALACFGEFAFLNPMPERT